MKNFKIILMVMVTMVFSITSCNKNDELLTTDNQLESYDGIINSRGGEDQMKVIDPSQMYANLNSLYGDMFYISSDSLKTGTHLTANKPVIVGVFPCSWVNYMYLTVVYTPNLQIQGVYILCYHPSKQNDGLESIGYEFEVFDPEGIAYPNCFTGCAVTNYYPPQHDSFTVYNWGIDIPSSYPYPLFDNIAVGTVDLEEIYTMLDNFSTKIKIALRIGLTIYSNYCGS